MDTSGAEPARPPASGRSVPVDPRPFDLPGRSGAVGFPGGATSGRYAALCLHGLTATPYEVRPLGEALAARGIRAVGPLLPGHGTSPQELARVRYGAWLESARAAWQTLLAEHAGAFLVGLSMGGLLALRLASETEPDGRGPRGLVVVGVPLRLPLPVGPLLGILRFVKPYLHKRGGSDIRDPEARARHPGYDRMPLASVRELWRLQRLVRPGLARVRAPILVAHGIHDRSARPADAREIALRVASEDVELLMLASSAHVVPVDHDGPDLARRAAEFLARYAS